MSCAFTMAEILLSLTIIGVVAAITLPSLTGNINERTWNTQRKALYARFSQAIALMPSLNGYGTLTEGNESTSAADTAAETFVTEGLSKVLKINNICDSEHLADCGIPTKVSDLAGQPLYSNGFPKTLSDFNSVFNGSYNADIHGDGSITVLAYSQINTKAAAFETANGESILVYYNPNCIADKMETEGYMATQQYMCANFIYDLNGNKGPNTVGKDIGFITSIYPSDSATVAPLPLIFKKADNMKQAEAGAYCRGRDEETRLPNRAEAMAMSYNFPMLAIAGGSTWTSEVYSAGPDGYGWLQYLGPARAFKGWKKAEYRVLCVTR